MHLAVLLRSVRQPPPVRDWRSPTPPRRRAFVLSPARRSRSSRQAPAPSPPTRPATPTGTPHHRSHRTSPSSRLTRPSLSAHKVRGLMHLAVLLRSVRQPPPVRDWRSPTPPRRRAFVLSP